MNSDTHNHTDICIPTVKKKRKFQDRCGHRNRKYDENWSHLYFSVRDTLQD